LRIRLAESNDRAQAAERDRLLSAIARDTEAQTFDRIAAIKELNKVDGRHVVRPQINGKVTLEQALTASRL
jgi:hypothetical protein